MMPNALAKLDICFPKRIDESIPWAFILLGSISKKLSSHLDNSGWSGVEVGGEGGVSESVKKGNLWKKIFSDNVEWSSKSCEK